MKLEAERFTIQLPRPFRIAHGSSAARETILVHIHGEGIDAYGEGALPPYYPSTAEASLSWLTSIAGKGDLAAWESECACGAPASAAAGRVALEIALQDLRAQKAGKPIWQLEGLNPAEIPACWRTISMPSSEHELIDMLDEAISHGSGCIKLKTGSGDFAWDKRCIQLAVARNIRLGLDVNQGWTPAQAAQILPKLGELNITFVEQPVGREDEENGGKFGTERVREDFLRSLLTSPCKGRRILPGYGTGPLDGVESFSRLVGFGPPAIGFR